MLLKCIPTIISKTRKDGTPLFGIFFVFPLATSVQPVTTILCGVPYFQILDLMAGIDFIQSVKRIELSDSHYVLLCAFALNNTS